MRRKCCRPKGFGGNAMACCASGEPSSSRWSILKYRAGSHCHRSSRSSNCAAIPDDLFESQVFGHQKGAFTGAHESFEGLLAQAHGGTGFLDEIGDLSPQSQARILRAVTVAQNDRIQREDVSCSDDTDLLSSAPDAESHLIREWEHRHIKAVLHACQGNVPEAAKRLGIGRSPLYRKLVACGIKP